MFAVKNLFVEIIILHIKFILDKKSVCNELNQILSTLK